MSTTTATMQLRSGRSIMRRDSRNYEEFNERRRYQREQKEKKYSIYDQENTLHKRIKKIYHKLNHLLYVNKYQNEKHHTFNEKMQTIIDIYEVIRINIDDLIQYFNNDYKHDKRLLEVIIRKGNVLLLEIYQKKRTRQENKNYKKCEDIILFVTDLIEYYIL